jgi:hypothetical protein
MKEIGWEVVDWIDLALDRGQLWSLANTVMKFYILLTVHHVMILGK